VTDGGENLLWSERRGGSLPLTHQGFATLLVAAFEECKAKGLFREVLRLGQGPLGFFRDEDEVADAFFSMKLGDPWPRASMRHAELLTFVDDDQIFDLIELVHREVVSRPPWGENPLARGPAQAWFRERINPILARRDPPMELTAAGHIVERGPDAFHDLVAEPLPVDVPAALRDPFASAVEQFRRRGATEHHKRSALTQLVGVLEPLRRQVREHLSSGDESDLFQIANRFWLRHHRRDQKRDYDADTWLDWMFYVYLATGRALLRVLDREMLEQLVNENYNPDEPPI